MGSPGPRYFFVKFDVYVTLHRVKFLIINPTRCTICRSQWPRSLRRRSAAARLLRSWVRIPPGAWMFVVSVVCCQVEVWRRADHSYRGVLPTVVRRSVWSRKRQEWGGHDPRWFAAPQKKCTNFSNLFLEWNSTCFGQFLCPLSWVFHRTHSSGICHTGMQTACEQDQDVPFWSCL
jgi:hypothetical protein